MIGTSRSVKLARLFGIRIGADPTWFIAVFLIVLVLQGRFADQLPQISEGSAYLLAVAAAAIFFLSLVAHELGHALCARRFGIQTEGIDLWLLGGVARLSRDSKSSKEEFFVAAAGPFVTLVVAVGFGALGVAMSSLDEIGEAATLAPGGATPGIALVEWLVAVNVVLFVFNLIPAFPLDGGRIARSIAWRVTGDRRRATRIAGGLGQGFAVVLLALGFYSLLENEVINGVWFLILAWFVYGAARAAVVTSDVSEQLHAVTAATIMDEQPVWVPSSSTAHEADLEAFSPFDVQWAPVLDEQGRYLGLVVAEQVAAELDAGRPTTKVGDLVQGGEHAPSTRPDATLDGLIQSEPLRRLGALPVVDAEGVMRGQVTAAGVRRALDEALPGAAGA